MDRKQRRRMKRRKRAINACDKGRNEETEENMRKRGGSGEK